MTLKQSSRLKKEKKKKFRRSKVRALVGGPQRKVIVFRKTERNPRKPNSAKRRVAFVRIIYTNKTLYCKIPGQGTIKEHTIVLLEGGGPKDLPGINYTLIRGTLGFTKIEDFERSKRRSKFGTKKVFNMNAAFEEARQENSFVDKTTVEFGEPFFDDLKFFIPYYSKKNRDRPGD